VSLQERLGEARAGNGAGGRLVRSSSSINTEGSSEKKANISFVFTVDPWAFVRGGGQGSMARVTARGSASFNGPVPGVTGGGAEARSGDVEGGGEQGETAGGVEPFPPLELTVSTSGLGLPDDALREHHAMKDGKGKGHRRRRSSWSELGF